MTSRETLENTKKVKSEAITSSILKDFLTTQPHL